MATLAHAKQSSQNVEYIFTDGVSDVEEDDEVFFCDDGTHQTGKVNRFDRIVGCLEELLMDPIFEEARANFCKTHCHHFEDAEENKLVYMELFQQYTDLVDERVEAKLAATLPDFDMEEFLGMLDDHKDELESEVFELLLSMADFESFKELMLAYKKDFASDASFKLVGKSVSVHLDEQEDGDERPDLDMGLLSVSKLAITGT